MRQIISACSSLYSLVGHFCLQETAKEAEVKYGRLSALYGNGHMSSIRSSGNFMKWNWKTCESWCWLRTQVRLATVRFIIIRFIDIFHKSLAVNSRKRDARFIECPFYRDSTVMPYFHCSTVPKKRNSTRKINNTIYVKSFLSLIAVYQMLESMYTVSC